MTFQPGTDAANARENAVALGCGAVDAETGSVLRFLACTLRARSVVEVGTGTGVSGLCLLEGMPVNGVLTSIDIEAERQRAARMSFVAAGFGPTRSRLITGRATDVLPRLSPGSYDLVFLDAMLAEYPRYFEQALPLLRTGGVLALHTPPMPSDNVHPDNDSTRILQAISNTVRHDERLVPTRFPLPNPLFVVALGE